MTIATIGTISSSLNDLLRKKLRGIERFDLAIGAAIVILAIALGVTVALGDRAGVGIVEMTPQGPVHTTTPLHIIFDEPMDTVSVETAFSIAPPTPGKITWTGSELTFKPDVSWQPDIDYTIRLRAGAHSLQNRRLTTDQQWTFRAAAPQVIYLAPALTSTTKTKKALSTDLWLIDARALSQGHQLTHSKYGVTDFAPSPDGTQIAFSQKALDGTVDLYLLTLDKTDNPIGDPQRLTNCVAARCDAPAWSPDGARIAYQRTELDSSASLDTRDAPRTWLLSPTDLSTAPLFSDSQLLGGIPRWSPDGTQIAFYDRNLGQIIVYDLTSGDRKPIPTQDGESGTYVFDPTGSIFVYPQLIGMRQGFTTEMALADFTTQTLKPLAAPDKSVDDLFAAWNPATKALTLTRRDLDSVDTASAQVVIVDPKTGQTQPLITDANYFHSVINWDPHGDKLVIQRLPQVISQSEAQPGIWVYDAATQKLWQVADNAYLPQWLP